jgi:hypothetical protein
MNATVHWIYKKQACVSYTDWTNNIVQYRLSPHCTICLIPSALTPESIRDKIYKILAYYINHIGITHNKKRVHMVKSNSFR